MNILVSYLFGDCIISVIVLYSIVKFTYSIFGNTHVLNYAVLLLAACIMFICVVLNTASFCESSTVYAPELNNEDAKKFFESAKFILGNKQLGCACSVLLRIPYLISLIWTFTGVNIISPLLMNIFLTLMSICMSGLIANRLFANLPEDKRAFVSAAAMLCTSSVCFYLGCRTLLLKEPMIYLPLVAVVLFSYYLNTTAYGISVM